MADASAVERDLAAYYDAEGAARAERSLAPGRVAARDTFLAGYVTAGMRSLEIGTGGGQDAAAFHAAGLTAVGVDLSPVFAGFTSATGAFEANASARALPFRDAAFDVIWSMSVLMHIPDDAIVESIDELRRVSSPGAVACIGVWGGDDDPRMLPGSHGDRFFANRSVATWRPLLERFGTVEQYDLWDPDSAGYTYHWAIVRRTL